jgi:transcription elongation GreA/GreB family factor
MTARVSIDSIPALSRPPEVEQAISDARTLRDRAREAAEAVAAAQQTFDAAEREDVESAAAAARAGQPVGAEGKAVREGS